MSELFDSELFDDGGPAFPCTPPANSDGVPSFGYGYPDPSSGMTLRDYFAAKALTGIIANRTVDDTVTFEQVAGRAYRQAEAMLKARAAK